MGVHVRVGGQFLGRWAVFWILLCGLGLRVAVAFLRTDAVWADETFQTLEPASWVVFGRGYLAWEWQTGYRTWVVPSLFMPLLALAKGCGIQGGIGLIALARFWMALLSVGVMWSLYRVGRLLGLSRLGASSGLLAYALSPAMILWSVTTLADALAMVTLWVVLPFVLRRIQLSSTRSAWELGMLVGLPFLMKVQTGAWILGVGGVLLFANRKDLSWPRLKRLGTALGGVLLMVLLLGIVDWATWGGFLQTAIKQVVQGAQISHTYGESPWYFYFVSLLTDQGAVFWISFALLGAANLFWNEQRRRTVQGAVGGEQALRWRGVWLPLFCFFIAHVCLDHKELRFLLPIFPAFYLLISVWMEPILCNVLDHSRRWTGFPVGLFLRVTGVCLGTWLIVYAALQMTLARPLLYSSVDSSAAEDAIYHDGGLSASGADCVALIDHNWSFTRGQMILGAPATFIDMPSNQLDGQRLAACRYVLLPARSEGLLIQAMAREQALDPSRSWQLIFRSVPQWGQAFALYKKQPSSGLSHPESLFPNR